MPDLRDKQSQKDSIQKPIFKILKIDRAFRDAIKSQDEFEMGLKMREFIL